MTVTRYRPKEDIVSTCEVTAAVEEISASEGRELVDGLARDRFGISAEDFLSRLDAGEYDGVDDEDVIRLRMLAPFAR